MQDLIKKYDVPVPRYTSYPTVPFWREQPIDHHRWMEHADRTFKLTNHTKGVSLYLHLPFCESLCTYCGCNKRITRNHKVEAPYIDTLLAEWRTYLRHFDEAPVLREIHLGGGTPTFFRPEYLRRLINYILGGSELHPEHNFGFEGSPNSTTLEHLETLFELGFRRLSLGVQDFDDKVQQAVNRIHSFDQVQQVVTNARSVGYKSINLDLIYGLPFQKAKSIISTFNAVGDLRPDRIAFYSYAHVPWKSPSQRGYSEDDLPKQSEKRQLYEIGRQMLTDMGYVDIGMDHFALRSDSICKAYRNKSLHRNFMGYTESQTDLLLGLGTSAISDCGTAYAQNEKTVEEYQRQVWASGLAKYRGHFLSGKDQLTRDVILQLICHGKANVGDLLENLPADSRLQLGTMQAEELVELIDAELTVSTKGKPFIRNICSIFDHYMWENLNQHNLFSKAI